MYMYSPPLLCIILQVMETTHHIYLVTEYASKGEIFGMFDTVCTNRDYKTVHVLDHF